MRAQRKLDSTGSSIEVEVIENGDVRVELTGQNCEGKPFKGHVWVYATLTGGGYHPRTIKALAGLVEAIKRDNEDPESPRQYRGDTT